MMAPSCGGIVEVSWYCGGLLTLALVMWGEVLAKENTDRDAPWRGLLKQNHQRHHRGLHIPVDEAPGGRGRSGRNAQPEWQPPGTTPHPNHLPHLPAPKRGETPPGIIGLHSGEDFREDHPMWNTSWAYRHLPWRRESFPNPRSSPQLCGRPHFSSVCDPENLLKEEEVKLLETYIQDICEETGCSCSSNCSTTCPGYKVGVAILPSAISIGHSDKQRDQDAVINQQMALWSDYLRLESWDWGLCSDDVILVLAANEKKVSLSAGEVAQTKLTHACADSVRQDAQGHLVAGELGRGLERILKDLKSVFQDDFKCELSFAQVMSTGKVIIIIFAAIGPVILGVVILIFLGPCFRDQGRGSTAAKNRSYYRRGGYEQAEMSIGLRGDD